MSTYADSIATSPLESAGVLADDQVGVLAQSTFSSAITFTGDLMYQPDEGRPIAFADLVKQHVLNALTDPVVIAAALIKLPQPIRDQVRVMLDALEQGSHR